MKRIVIEKNFYKIKNSNINYDLDVNQKILKTNLNFFPKCFVKTSISRNNFTKYMLRWWSFRNIILVVVKDFESQNVNYPILLNRNSALIIDFKLSKKIKNLNIDLKDLLWKKIVWLIKKLEKLVILIWTYLF